MIGIQQLCTSTYMKVAFPDKAEVDFTRAAATIMGLHGIREHPFAHIKQKGIFP